MSEFSIGPYEPGDEHAILAVFNKVFDWQERSLAVWTWEFLDNPAGTHVFIAKTDDGAVVSQFAGIPRRVKVRDEERIFAEIVDSLTDPDYRKGLKKPGVFASTCYNYVDHFGRPDRETIMYGLPVPQALRVGQALLGYVPLYRLHLLAKQLEGVSAEWSEEFPDGHGTCRRVDAFAPDVNDLYDRFSADKEVMTVRRKEYLDWRFAHPEVDYERYEFRDRTGHLFGIAVLRHAWLDDPHTAIVEWMMEIGHTVAGAALQRLEERARQAGMEEMRVLVQPESDHWRAFEKAGYVSQRSKFPFVARTYDRDAVPLDWLKEAWWITLSDFDVA